jgi:hypothetical protein
MKKETAYKLIGGAVTCVLFAIIFLLLRTSIGSTLIVIACCWVIHYYKSRRDKLIQVIDAENKRHARQLRDMQDANGALNLVIDTLSDTNEALEKRIQDLLAGKTNPVENFASSIAKMGDSIRSAFTPPPDRDLCRNGHQYHNGRCMYCDKPQDKP